MAVYMPPPTGETKNTHTRGMYITSVTSKQQTSTFTLAVVVVVEQPVRVSTQRPPPGDLPADLGPRAPVRRPIVLVELQELQAIAYFHLGVGHFFRCSIFVW